MNHSVLLSSCLGTVMCMMQVKRHSRRSTLVIMYIPVIVTMLLVIEVLMMMVIVCHVVDVWLSMVDMVGMIMNDSGRRLLKGRKRYILL
jgi:hypothetical protein